MARRFQADQHSIRAEHICFHARTIIQRLQKAGYEAYIVGGAIRDLLQGSKPKDFDIATNATPEQVRNVFNNCRLIGRRFRLAHVYFGKTIYEVATFRAPHDASLSGVTNNTGRILHDNVYGTMEEDAIRRDFTVNALYYNPLNNEIIDYVGGMEDAKQRQLKLIGDPLLRYREDPVRMLRAIRIATKLGYTIDEESEAPIQELAYLLNDISSARLFDECLKLFHSGIGLAIFYQLRYYHLYEYLFPLTEMALRQEYDDNTDGHCVFLNFIETALNNTDRRINEGLSVTPAFLIAVKLWLPQKIQTEHYLQLGEPAYQASQLAASDIFRKQITVLSIPRRFSTITREIWQLQDRFDRRHCRAAKYFVSHRRFRAAYDFYCLRAQGFKTEESLCQWWTDFYNANEDEQTQLCSPFAPKKKKYRRRYK